MPLVTKNAAPLKPCLILSISVVIVLISSPERVLAK